MDKEKYLFRRQFILGPRLIEGLPGWKQVAVNDQFFLTIHPDLHISKISSNNNFIVLLGFILDPYNPSFDNVKIIQKIIENVSTANDVFHLIDTKGGRFVMIVKVNNDLRIFNDAAGFRQIFYYKDGSNNIWCASQPSIIAEQCNLNVSEDIREDLSCLPLFRKTSISYWYPGNITLYRDMLHLIPNHYLDLNSGEVVRYWPRKQLKSVSLQECVENSSEILQGLFESACNRFDLAFAITAGYDTRVLLAACKRVKEKIYFFSHTHSTLSKDGLDITIPKAMLNKVGLNHHIAYHFDKMSVEFEELFNRNVTGAKTWVGLHAYAIYQHLNNINNEMVVINGEIGGIGKSFYKLPPFFNINAKTLAALTLMRGSKVAEEAFDTWLKSARKAVPYGVSMLDLLYLEMRLGNWSAMGCSLYDIAFESFSPFNCKRLIENMISVDRKYRLPPNYTHIHIVRKVWPEILKFPINPPIGKKDAITKKLKGTRLHGVYRFIKFLYHYSAGSN